jgi:hypothetical protein
MLSSQSKFRLRVQADLFTDLYEDTMRKPNGKHPEPATDTNASSDTINFDDAVAEGKAIITKIEEAERGQLRLGELADQLETQYGDRTLAKYAEALDIAPCTLKRYRDVYRAWKGKISAPGRVSYAVLRELAPNASDPECQEAIRDNLNMTKRAALDLKRKLDNVGKEKAQETKEEAEAAEALRETKKWWSDVVTGSNQIRGLADVTHHCTTDEQWSRVLENVEQQQLMYVRGSGNTQVRLADLLEYLLDKQVSEDFASHIAQWEQAHDRERERRIAYSDLKARRRHAKASRATTGAIVPPAQKATAVHAAA